MLTSLHLQLSDEENNGLIANSDKASNLIILKSP